MLAKAKRGRPAEKDRRENILDAALQCFVERGFYGTTIPEIATQASIASGTIYHYFDSKEALVNALFRHWKGHISQRVLAAFPQGATSREQFRTMWHEIIGFAMAEPTAFAFIELHKHTSYLDAESKAIDGTTKTFAHMMIQRAQIEGVVKPLDTWVLMELIFGAFVGMMRASYEGRVQLTEETIAGAEQACWDAISIH
ncbi:MAG: TetR family transcriptional regulator [Myxococcota bacterium]|nr:TetR family transcriptional regulator [Myxococcota bacterium]